MEKKKKNKKRLYGCIFLKIDGLQLLDREDNLFLASFSTPLFHHIINWNVFITIFINKADKMIFFLMLLWSQSSSTLKAPKLFISYPGPTKVDFVQQKRKDIKNNYLFALVWRCITITTTIDRFGQLNVVPNSNPLWIKRFVPSISMSFKGECYIIMQP